MSPDNLILLGIAATNLMTGAIAFATLIYARRTEVNTNSMRDALVKTTAVASHAQGVDEERVRGKLEAAVLAEGVLSGKEKLP